MSASSYAQFKKSIEFGSEDLSPEQDKNNNSADSSIFFNSLFNMEKRGN